MDLEEMRSVVEAGKARGWVRMRDLAAEAVARELAEAQGKRHKQEAMAKAQAVRLSRKRTKNLDSSRYYSQGLA